MQQRYAITIYHAGVHWDVRMRGEEHYLLEKGFLDSLVGRARAPHLPPRPVPDPPTDFYMLDDQQLDAYLAFRKRRKRKVSDDL